jgi:putative tricarboxylic transport membrane protein
VKTQSLIASCLWLLVGSYVAIHAYGMGLGHLHSPGPGFIFFLTALLLVALTIVDTAGTLVRKKVAGEGAAHVWSGVRWKKLLVLLGGIAAYVYLFNLLGFAFSTFLLMILLFKGIEPTRWWIAVMSAFITTILSYLIFKMWLGVPFPTGILGF